MGVSDVTRGLRTGFDNDPAHRSVAPPLHLSSNFSFADLDTHPEHAYSRTSNPTRRQLAEALATLHGGTHASVTVTGMAAITLLVQACVPNGGRVVVPEDCYGGTWRLMQRLSQTGRLQADFVAPGTEPLLRALEEPASLVFVETPTNPLLRLVDLQRVAQAAKHVEAVLAVDNTFCGPLVQRPLEHGADVVVESTTKLINGHSDALGGVLVTGRACLGESFAEWSNTLGLPSAPFDCYLTLRGLRTLDARLRVQQISLERVVEALVCAPGVRAVHHPSLPGHPDRDLAARQQQGHGPVLSFELNGGLDAARAFVKGLQVVTLAESLGGCESLIAHPASMTHAAVPAPVRQATGITEGLLRLSVGLEQTEDLVADICAALERSEA